MLKIYRPAVRVGKKVYVASKAGMTHREVIEHFGVAGTAERGFVVSGGHEFVGRTEGAEIAKAAGQVPDNVGLLHSEDLPEYKKRKGK